MANALGSDASALRMVRPEQLHLTLVFFGEVTEERVGLMTDALKTPLDEVPYMLALGGAGVFPPHGAPRVLWIGVMAGAAETIAVRAAILGRLARVGGYAGPDSEDAHERRFTPHLTVARWRDGRPRHRRALEPHASPEGSAVASMRVEAVTLFHSRLGSAGASHTPLVRTRLGGA